MIGSWGGAAWVWPPYAAAGVRPQPHAGGLVSRPGQPQRAKRVLWWPGAGWPPLQSERRQNLANEEPVSANGSYVQKIRCDEPGQETRRSGTILRAKWKLYFTYGRSAH